MKTQHMDVSKNLEDNLNLLQNHYFNEIDDLHIRHVDQSGHAVVYLYTMVDKTILDRDILPVLSIANAAIRPDAFPVGSIQQVRQLEQVAQALMQGQVAVVFQGLTFAYLIPALGYHHRSIEEPQTETSLRGPKEGFIENADTNVALLRQRIPSSLLKNKKYTFGNITKTSVFLVYLENAANSEMIATVKNRIQQFVLNDLVASFQLIEYIQDHPRSLFPLLASTERPDRIVFELLDGGFAIIVDGTPFVVYGPVKLTSLLKTPDDYYFSYVLGTFVRLLRLGALTITLLRLRENGVSNISDVKFATLEPNGQLGYELTRDAKPVTIGELERILGLKSGAAMEQSSLFQEVKINHHPAPIDPDLQ